MSETASGPETIRRLMMMLREAMLDPSLSGGCPLLAGIFEAIAEERDAQPLLSSVPAWKLPGLLLSAALLYRALAAPAHPLASYLPGAGSPLASGLRAAVRRTLLEDGAELGALMAMHTYQCNPPRRMAASLVAAAAVTDNWTKATHLDIGTASGVGLFLGEVRVESANAALGPSDAVLNFPIELRGAALDLDTLKAPKIECSIGIDLDPPNLRDPDCRAWMRACQFPIKPEWDWFDYAAQLVIERNPRIEQGSAIDILPRLARSLPWGLPLIVTDTYTTAFMSEQEREEFRGQLDDLARSRPVAWISNNPLVPVGPDPDCTTAGTPIPPELVERNRRALFGVVCATTWPNGQRTPRLLALNHPGACWIEWRPDL